ncbi:MAG: cellulase family glycosylhydrolase [Bacteroidales bacterium]|nr:cellulase family glycosylhydrolase [Bacteroidales bacterium]
MKNFINAGRGLGILFLSLLFAFNIAGAQNRASYVGGDISLLPEYEKAGAQYKDENGRTIKDLIPWCAEQGMNSMRVRVFVNPELYQQKYGNSSNPDLKYDPNACQTIESVVPLCKRIVDAGMALMIDFHYSDTWADPAKQWTPIEWQGLTDAQLTDKIYDYTCSSLQLLKDNGITPSFIQTGNEISYGMLWGAPESGNPKKVYTNSTANWSRFAGFLHAAGKACREIFPDAKIVIHTERTAEPTVLSQYYQKIASRDIDYDIIGLSYYPYFHGSLSTLDNSLKALRRLNLPQQIMLVETGYSYKWAVPGTTHDFSSTWPYTEAGQQKFAQQLVELLIANEVTGLYWWWMEYNAYNTKLSGWYNAPLFDSTTGKVTAAFRTICSFSHAYGSLTDQRLPEVESGRWFDSLGRSVENPSTPGLYINSNGKKMMITE